MKSRYYLLFAFLFAGAAVSLYWIGLADVSEFARRHPAKLLLCLLVTMTVCSLNLGIRWFRWHALTRHTGLRLAARTSVLLWLATLPAILTPFYIGEWSRAALLRKEHPASTGPVLFVWFLERSTDLFILLVFYLLAAHSILLLAGVVLFWAGCAAVSGRILGKSTLGRFYRPSNLALLFGTTTLAWALAVLALWGLVRTFGGSPSAELAAIAFSGGTLLGGFTGLPQGIGVTGSTIITLLQSGGIDLATAVVAVVVFRAGTAWYAVILGGLALGLGGRALGRRLFGLNGINHFDEIAENYVEQIPEHVRERLLQRKIDIMLGDAGGGVYRTGLDIGCGQGWYCTALAERGVAMSAIDASADQIERARNISRAAGVHVDYRVGRADRLPYSENSFDFCYAINVMHHIADPQIRNRTYAEIIRVLKPGGTFFLHEMNVRNPIFRFYINYLFPLLRNIDEGTEKWLLADRLPDVAGAEWDAGIDYLTFMPDFIPRSLFRFTIRVEQFMERSRLRRFSAHYLARLRVPGNQGSCKINKRIRKTG